MKNKQSKSTIDKKLQKDEPQPLPNGYQVNQLVEAQYKDGTWKQGKIIEIKEIDEEGKKEAEGYIYLVQYQGQSKRFSKWLKLEDIKIIEQKNDELVEPKKKKKLKQTPQIELDERQRNEQQNEQIQKVKKDKKGNTEEQKESKSETTDELDQPISQQPKPLEKLIQSIQLGTKGCDTQFYSPFAEEYQFSHCLYVCEYCFSYFVLLKDIKMHWASCDNYKKKSPPGQIIYKDTNQKLFVFEIAGKDHPNFLKNLNIVAKLFIEFLCLEADVEQFKIYFLTQLKQQAYHPIGYFSKQIISKQNFSLSCLFVFPFYQKLGYGQFLISLSYYLWENPKSFGTPEKPLSQFARHCYLHWWTLKISETISDKKDQTVKELSQKAKILEADVLYTIVEELIFCQDQEQYGLKVERGKFQVSQTDRDNLAIKCKQIQPVIKFEPEKIMSQIEKLENSEDKEDKADKEEQKE